LSPNFFTFPIIIIISPLLHYPPEVRDSSVHAAHHHTLGLQVGGGGFIPEQEFDCLLSEDVSFRRVPKPMEQLLSSSVGVEQVDNH
jgi:hypothetical protein